MGNPNLFYETVSVISSGVKHYRNLRIEIQRIEVQRIKIQCIEVQRIEEIQRIEI